MPHAAHTSPRAWFLCVAQGPSPPVHATPSGHHGSETPHAAPTVSPAGCHPMAIRTQPPQWHQQFTTWTPDYVTGPAGEEDTRNGGAYALSAASPAGDGHGVRSPGAACPSATPGTGGGARVRIAAPAERWGGFGTRVSGSRDRPAMSLAHFPTWLGKGRVSPSQYHEASLQAQPSAVPHADTAPGHGLAGRPDLHHSAIRVMSTGQARWMTSLGSGPGARPNLHWPTHRLPNTSGALCQPHVVTVLGSRDVAVFWVGDDSERERGQAPGDSSPPNPASVITST